MYCPDPFAETRPEILRALIQRLQVRDDPDWVRQQMVTLIAQQENDFTLPW